MTLRTYSRKRREFLLGVLGAGVASRARASEDAMEYFPLPDSRGGWRSVTDAAGARRVAEMSREGLNAAFEVAAGSTRNGGLLVLRNGWLVYERYFGRGHRDAAPNLASCGKSFTSIALGILMAERPELFPDGLAQKVFTPAYFPPEAFPLSDPRKTGIRLGQLLAFTAGIRGNNPSYVDEKEVALDPPGPDGWQAAVDDVALGRRDMTDQGRRVSAATLWCEPGGGYSYASASIHLASMIIRHVAGKELQEFVRSRLAEPIGWGRWNYAYRNAKEITHTPGMGGIALRGPDMLRFGYLLLRGGRWRVDGKKRQLVPAEYIRACGRKSPYNPYYPYSLQFNVNTDGQVPELPRDAFWKTGSGGHALYVVPSLDLVVWKLGGRDDQYSPANTGLPLPAESLVGGETRRDWKASVDEPTAARATLQRVIEAIK